MDLCTASALGLRNKLKEYIKRDRAALLLPNRKGWTPLMYACIYCREETVALLVKSVPSCIYSVNSRLQTALMLSAQSGNLNIVRMLSKPEILECEDGNGWTALFHAVYYGHADITYHLIRCGANTNARDYKGWTVLMAAIQEDRENIVMLLLASGAKCYHSSSGTRKCNAMNLARQSRRLNLIILLSINTVKDLDSLLHNLRLDDYSTFFKQNDIDLSKFLQLNECNLKLLGVSKIGPRKIMALTTEKYNQYYNFKKQLETDL